jgi:protein-S-isoprenylcysteine O-methyltransferase Ste14
MNTNTFVKPNGQPDLTAAIWRRMLQVVVQFLILAAILFVAAGRLDWGMAWAYLGVYVGIIVINMLVLLRVSPELIAERGQIRQDAKEWDKWFGGIVSLIGPLTTLLVAGLNARFGWPPTLAPAIQLAALVGMALGYGFSGWAMASNKFFAGLVRIQTERGHTVASGGPYRYVRHPGYSGWSLAYLVTPLVLGSVWALIPAALTVAVLIVRTALEDRTLQAELDGYADYARQVRYRLLPGVW